LEIFLPQVKTIGADGFCNSQLVNVFLPSLQVADRNAFRNCKLQIVILPSILKAGTASFCENHKLETFSAPLLQTAGDYLLCDCFQLKNVLINKVKFGEFLLHNSAKVENVLADNLKVECNCKNCPQCLKVLEKCLQRGNHYYRENKYEFEAHRYGMSLN
jgi:hypothetical protein